MINCTKCGETKDESQFRPRPKLIRGYNSWCRECEKIANRNKYVPKPPRTKKVVDEKVVKLETKKRMLKHRYSIDYNSYIQMYDEQDGKCKICGIEKELGGSNGLLVDHCHNTNKVRGLLCNNCNSGLGKFKDNKELLLRAIEYISIVSDKTN
jgi:hypothetical protein